MIAQRDRIVQVATALYADIEAENAAVLALRHELAATFGGEMRCLRSIMYAVIKEMVVRLG